MSVDVGVPIGVAPPRSCSEVAREVPVARHRLCRVPGDCRARWISRWQPEDEEFWAATGARIARRNLLWSVVTEHVGFSLWAMWSALVLFLGPEYGLTAAQKFTLTSVPVLVGSLLRLPYTLAVVRFGGRNWTVFSAGVLLVPALATTVLLEPWISYGTLLVLAAVTGVGGASFASSTANINVFFPARLKGRALAVNAAAGNLGVAVVQLVALVVLATAGAAHPRLVVGVYIPLVVLAALAAALRMDNLSSAVNSPGALRAVVRQRHAWVISFLYIGTFGSFIGFGFAFGQVLQVQFADHFATPLSAAYLTFLGPLTGALARPIGGWLADHLGGARVTLWSFAAMAASAALVLWASQSRSLGLFLVGFVALFVFSGMGNGSTYKMIPAVFAARAERVVATGGDRGIAEGQARRLAGALIGVAGAVGAFGGVLVNVSFRQSFLHTGTGEAAYTSFLVFYAACFALTWAVYVRPSRSRLAGV
jgi:NNP family nitrate/nitrite transporter-like MFS transporter